MIWTYFDACPFTLKDQLYFCSMIIYHLLFSTLLLVWSCKNETEAEIKNELLSQIEEISLDSSLSVTSEEIVFPYDLDEYSEVYSLERPLLEISGLGYDLKSGKIMAVNDEQGYIFSLDPNDKMSISEKWQFGNNGDYEGIEVVNDIIYVVKSNGTIYSFDPKIDNKAESHKNSLTATNDIEGLAFDASRDGLLLACKGRPYFEPSELDKKLRAFYLFDLKTNMLSEEPVFTILDKDLKALVVMKYMDTGLSATAVKNLQSRIKSFSPSGISYNPIDKNLYILSSQGKSLVICDRQGQLVDIGFLDEDIHRQPEGLCFDPSGNMYISNEGSGLVAKIYRYNYKK